ncbi:MAG: helix-turn-helix transcriptional regulator, partial [Dethiobacteria bacterium]|nr:helix-turn-helix transcriptional regulator [Dethiobacteria bacterium]
MIMTLKDRRLLNGMTQQQLAEKAGLSQPTIALFESGKVGIIPTVAIKLSNALGCSTVELLDSQVQAAKSTVPRINPQVEALLDVSKKAAAIHPMAGAAIIKEAIRLQKAAIKDAQRDPDRDLYGRKLTLVDIERDHF